MRILFAGGGTGGHLYPGLAIAHALGALDAEIAPFFIGAKRGIERDVLPQTGYPYALLDLHPIYRVHFYQNWRTVWGGVSAWRGLGAIVASDRPSLVVGTGGYAAGLTMAYAVARGIPLVQQAGDRIPGLTARSFSRFSREMYLAFPEAAEGGRLKSHHPGSLIDTGAPIEPPPEPRPDRRAARARWGFPEVGPRVLLIYGGSQGSLALNRVVGEWVAKGIPDDLRIIWGTGKGTFAEFRALQSDRVRVCDYIAPIADAYAASDLAVARAGAMTTAELMAWGIPPILVPLPTAAADHQTLNAAALASAGAAIHLPQASLTADLLGGTVRGLLDDQPSFERLRAGALKRARPHAAETIARRILALVGRSAS